MIYVIGCLGGFVSGFFGAGGGLIILLEKFKEKEIKKSTSK